MNVLPLGQAFRIRIGLLLSVAFAAVAGARQPASFDAKEYLARSLARLALVDLRAISAPQESDYKLASLLLSMACEISPADDEILRRKIEAAYACGDDKAVLEATRALVGLDKKATDTVAQLRLITALISQKAQIAEDRLQVYDQFIADKRIDAAIRSRLALDAALLLRERGDDEGFRKKLALSCQLDSSHKEAAALFAAVISERRPDDAAGRFLALQNLLMADPLDPNVHLAICRELVAARAFKAARRFHNNANIIMQLAQIANEHASLESMVLEMYTDGPAALVASMNKELQLAKDEVAKDIRDAQQAGFPTDNLKLKYDDIRFTPNTHVMYVIALAAAGDQNAAAASLSDFSAYVALTAKASDDSVRRGKMPPEQALRGIAELTVQLELARAVTGLQLDLVRKELTENNLLVERFPEPFARIQTWLLAREGNPDQAIEQFEPSSLNDSFSLLGIAVCHEAAGRQDKAIEAYNTVLAQAPLDPAGAWARTRLLALGYKEDAAAIAAMESAAAKIPAWIDAMAIEPQRFVQLRVEVSDRDPGGMDRGALHLTLQNLATIPLALGPDRPINSRLLIAPKLEVVSGGAIDLARPEVVHVDRRLRLMPNESLDLDVWPDSGQCGWLLEALANRSIRLRWRVIQGFRPDRRGGFVAGLMGIATETAAAIRRPLPEATLSPESLAKQVTEGPTNLLPRLAAVARANLIQPLVMPKLAEAVRAAAPGKAPEAAPPPQPDAEVQMKPVADAFAGRFAKLGVNERCMLVLTLPHARISPVMQPVDQVMLAETDPTVLSLVLCTRVIDPKDPLLARCKESDEPRLREVATLIAERLTGNDPVYARWVTSDIGKRPAPLLEPPAPKPDPQPAGAPK